MRRLVVAGAVLLLAGCETPYQNLNSLTGGVRATRVDETTLHVEAAGNEMTSQFTIERYVLRKASEETLAAGYDYFGIMSDQDTSRTGSVYIPGQTTSNTTVTGYRNTATATTHTYSTPGQAYATYSPGRTVVVRMFKGQKPSNAALSVYDAREVLKYMVPAKK